MVAFAVFGFAGSAAAQTVKITGNDQWQLVKSDTDYKVYTKEIACLDPKNGFDMQKLLVKVENLTSANLIIEFDKKLSYDGECKKCDVNSKENHIRIVLGSKVTLESDCTVDEDGLTTFIAMIGRPGEKLTAFEFTNFVTYK